MEDIYTSLILLSQYCVQVVWVNGAQHYNLSFMTGFLSTRRKDDRQVTHILGFTLK